MTTELTLKDVCRIARVSARQVQWWAETGLVSPPIAGHRRLYTLTELSEVMLVAELRRKHVALKVIRSTLHRLRKKDRATLNAALSGDAYILVDWRTHAVHVEANPGKACDIILGSLNPMCVIQVPVLSAGRFPIAEQEVA